MLLSSFPIPSAVDLDNKITWSNDEGSETRLAVSYTFITNISTIVHLSSHQYIRLRLSRTAASLLYQTIESCLRDSQGQGPCYQMKIYLMLRHGYARTMRHPSLKRR